MTVPRWDLGSVRRDRHLADPGSYEEPYQRYALTPSGVSPRLVPLQSSWPVIVDSDEHDETGHLTEDLDMRNRMVEKRLRRIGDLSHDMDEPVILGRGPTLLVGWGSSFGALEEVVQNHPSDLRLIHFSEIWPLRTERLVGELERTRFAVAVEGNATAQFAQLVARETGKRIDHSILRYDGRPLTAAYIESKLHDLEVL
jgi:2-oxoglutarate ferredoxin oxidoreductase subunit alpha